jgi:hypothetical protein
VNTGEPASDVAPEREVFDTRADERPQPFEAINTGVTDFTKMDVEIGKALPQNGYVE